MEDGRVDGQEVQQNPLDHFRNRKFSTLTFHLDNISSPFFLKDPEFTRALAALLALLDARSMRIFRFSEQWTFVAACSEAWDVVFNQKVQSVQAFSHSLSFKLNISLTWCDLLEQTITSGGWYEQYGLLRSNCSSLSRHSEISTVDNCLRCAKITEVLCSKFSPCV